MDEAHFCQVCKEPALQRCSSCQVTYYCSRDHQRHHWKKHRLNCCAYRKDVNSIVGRHLIASRDLRSGEVIIREKPLVVGPKQITRPVCLGCYSLVDGSYECPRCRWPMCGMTCCNSSEHVAECALMTKDPREKMKVVDFQKDHPSYQSIMVLRCLYLRDREPAMWKELLKLESHSEERKSLGLEHLDRAVVVQFIRSHLQLGDDYPEELILKICGILCVNSFELPLAGNGAQAIYSIGSLLEHDCVPNACKTFNENKEMVIRAAIPISKGEKIAICYTDPMWGTANRRHHLKHSKFFSCGCERCKDPTELSTFLSAVRCSNCIGYLLADNPLNDESPWTCAACNGTKPAEEIHALMEEIGKRLVSMPRGEIGECEKFLRDCESQLHPNHFYLAEVKLALCQMYGHEEGQHLIQLDDNVIEMKEKLCLDLLKIVDTLSPGLTRIRGVLLYELQALIAVRSRKLCLEGTISREELRNHVKVVQKMLQEAVMIFSWEPESSDEGRLAKIAALELADVDLFLKTLQ